jgi:hypothetical protein
MLDGPGRADSHTDIQSPAKRASTHSRARTSRSLIVDAASGLDCDGMEEVRGSHPLSSTLKGLGQSSFGWLPSS